MYIINICILSTVVEYSESYDITLTILAYTMWGLP